MLAAQDTFRGFGPFIFIVLFVCVIVGWATAARLDRALRERHPGIYDSLGQPTPFWNNSMKNSFAMLGFIFSGRFRETQDREIIRLCHFLRAFHCAYFALFITVVVLGFILSAR